MNKVEIKLNLIPIIRKANEEISRDKAEIACRSLIETSIADCIVAFQSYCEAICRKELPNEKLVSNVFQRIEDGNNLWKRIFQEGYDDWISLKEYSRINTLFQRRHLLAHTDGIVDDKYLQKTSDTNYKLGQRIVVNKSDVTELLEIIRKIITRIRELKTNN